VIIRSQITRWASNANRLVRIVSSIHALNMPITELLRGTSSTLARLSRRVARIPRRLLASQQLDTRRFFGLGPSFLLRFQGCLLDSLLGCQAGCLGFTHRLALSEADIARRHQRFAGRPLLDRSGIFGLGLIFLQQGPLCVGRAAEPLVEA